MKLKSEVGVDLLLMPPEYTLTDVLMKGQILNIALNVLWLKRKIEALEMCSRESIMTLIWTLFVR